MKIDADHKLMDNYFFDSPVFCKKYFRHWFRMSTDLFKHIAECVKLHDPFVESEEELHWSAWA
jgi:hypothetical protein